MGEPGILPNLLGEPMLDKMPDEILSMISMNLDLASVIRLRLVLEKEVVTESCKFEILLDEDYVYRIDNDYEGEIYREIFDEMVEQGKITIIADFASALRKFSDAEKFEGIEGTELCELMLMLDPYHIPYVKIIKEKQEPGSFAETMDFVDIPACLGRKDQGRMTLTEKREEISNFKEYFRKRLDVEKRSRIFTLRNFMLSPNMRFPLQVLEKMNFVYESPALQISNEEKQFTTHYYFKAVRLSVTRKKYKDFLDRVHKVAEEYMSLRTEALDEMKNNSTMNSVELRIEEINYRDCNYYRDILSRKRRRIL